MYIRKKVNITYIKYNKYYDIDTIGACIMM